MARLCHGCGGVRKTQRGKRIPKLASFPHPPWIRIEQNKEDTDPSIPSRTPRPPPCDDPDDCFEAARRGYTIRLTCWACGHQSVLHAAALWWHVHKKGRPDTFRILRQNARCRPCEEKRRQIITNPILGARPRRSDGQAFPRCRARGSGSGSWSGGGDG